MKKKLEFELATSKAKKLLAGMLLLLGLRHGTEPKAADEKHPEIKKTEMVKPHKKSDKETFVVNAIQTNYSPVTLNTFKDMEKLFDQSLNIIFAELILEEVPMPRAYDDGGLYAGKKNTFGVGSTYSPIDIKNYSDTTAKWYHLYTNPKTFGSRTVSYEEMLQLVIGWGRYRKITQDPKTKEFHTRKIVLERMFNLLKGASLRPNEFAALYCAAYNNENNIQKLCPFVKDNYKDPIACANKIMTWCQTGPANGGTKDRCEFEALVYLNHNGFCQAMLDMYTKPLKKTGCSCINVEGVVAKTLTKENYKKYSDDAKAKYLSVVYKGGVRTGDICDKVKKYFKNSIEKTDSPKISFQKEYDEATVLYRNADFQAAIEKFLALRTKGATGCDLLNDIAITYFNLKQYDDCIDYCKKVLQTTEKQQYAKACFNAGRAYEAKGMYDRAIMNYTKASEYYSTYGISDEDESVDYKKIYEAAIQRATTAKNQSTLQKNGGRN